MRRGLGQHGFNFRAVELRNCVAHNFLNSGFVALRKLRARLGDQVTNEAWRIGVPIVAPLNTFSHQVSNRSTFGCQQRATIDRGCLMLGVGACGSCETFVGGRRRTERANFYRACLGHGHVNNFRGGLLRIGCVGIVQRPQRIAFSHHLKRFRFCNCK